MQSLLTMLDSPPAAYAIGVPAIMLGSILLVAIIALLGPRHDHHDHTTRGR